jgi:hypothetical protein
MAIDGTKRRYKINKEKKYFLNENGGKEIGLSYRY